MSTFTKILSHAVKHGASDVHLTVGSPPAVRIDGAIHFIDAPPLTPEDTMGFVDELMDEKKKARFIETGDADLAHGVPGLGRFRVNCLYQRGSVGMVMRHVKGKIVDFAALNLPESIANIADMYRGLVLITGTTGSGKSTTLASIIDWINQRKRFHIITLEDPIEFLHNNKKSIITQREIHLDTINFNSALRAAMREDPDVILVGEMRDAETFQAAISAAETGHLVFSTLHTTNAMLTLDRILDMFPPEQHHQVRSQISLQLKSSIAQRLIPSADGKGRVPAVEILINNPSVGALIRENQIKQIPLAIASGQKEGMQSFNNSLVGLIKKGLIKKEDAIIYSDNADELNMNLQGIYLSKDRGGILKR